VGASSLTGTVETFIRERPAPADGASHYGRGRPEDPRTPVTNEDYAAMLCTFASGARGTFEVSRTLVGPESENAFDVYGTRGAVGAPHLVRISRMIHDFDMARFVTGTEVVEVFARGALSVSAADARAPLVIGLAAARSLREGRPVRTEEVERP